MYPPSPSPSFQTHSMQSLSGNSSCLSSFSTISTHVPPYLSTSPDSPVELDAPKRPKEASRTAKTNPSELSCSRSYSQPADDNFGSKYGFDTVKTTDIGEPSVKFPPPCPFPSPGGVQKEPPERKLVPSKYAHPLSASARSDFHRHADKSLHERKSHPEFHISKRDIQIANRAKSFDSAKRDATELPPIVSPSREHINSLASALCDNLEHNVLSQHHSTSLCDPRMPLHPLLKSLRTSLGSQAHRFGLSPDHQKCLSDLTLSPAPQSSFASLDSSSSSSSMLSFQEVNYEIVEGPLDDSPVWDEDGSGREAFATLVYKVQLCDPTVQLRSQMNQGDIALLKVMYTAYFACFKCMGAMLANPHDPYIQRGYCPFVINNETGHK